MATKRYEELEARAEKGSPALVTAYRKEVGTLAMVRKRFLAAAKVEAPGTEGLSATTVRTTAVIRDKSGAAGADRLSYKGGRMEATTATGEQRWTIGVDAGRLNSGTPDPNTPIGTGPSPTAFDSIVSLATPWLRWDLEKVGRALSIAIGTTPVGGTIDPLPVAAVKGQFDGDNVIATATLRAAPRYDSLLAMGGLRGGATGLTWGRVVEIGPQVGGILLLSPDLSLSANAGLSTIRGRSVVSNTHASGSASLTYEFNPAGFDYLRVGASYAFDHYANNQNFFTFGHGGYYSPSQGHNIGLFADLLTPEGRTWQVGARASASYQYSVEAAALRLPFSSDPSIFPRFTQSQVGTDSSVRAAFLLAPQLIVGAYGHVTYAPSGRDVSAGLMVAIPFGKRSAVFSSDLPRLTDRTWP